VVVVAVVVTIQAYLEKARAVALASSSFLIKHQQTESLALPLQVNGLAQQA
jgi:hypothetical protein